MASSIASCPQKCSYSANLTSSSWIGVCCSVAKAVSSLASYSFSDLDVVYSMSLEMSALTVECSERFSSDTFNLSRKGFQRPEIIMWQVKEDSNLSMKSWCHPFVTALLLRLHMVDELYSKKNHIRNNARSQVYCLIFQTFLITAIITNILKPLVKRQWLCYTCKHNMAPSFKAEPSG